MLEIVPVPVLSDNYVWLVHDPASGETVAVDPSVADPVLAAAAARGWRISQIWNTHWHPDHTGGNDAIRAATGCTITGPAEAERVSKMDRIVAGGDRARIGAHRGRADRHPRPHRRPCRLPSARRAGRLRRRHLVRDGLRPPVRGQCRGRCTPACSGSPRCRPRRASIAATNIRWPTAASRSPSSRTMQRSAHRVAEVEEARDRGEVTLPTTIALERATNPFMRAASVEELAARRAAKDAFLRLQPVGIRTLRRGSAAPWRGRASGRPPLAVLRHAIVRQAHRLLRRAETSRSQLCRSHRSSAGYGLGSALVRARRAASP